MGDVAEQMDAEHLLFCPLHWPEILWATKIIFAISTNTFCNFNKYNIRFGHSAPKHKNKRASKLQILHIQNWKGLFGNRLMTEWSLMTNLLQIINRANPSTPLGCQQNKNSRSSYSHCHQRKVFLKPPNFISLKNLPDQRM